MKVCSRIVLTSIALVCACDHPSAPRTPDESSHPTGEFIPDVQLPTYEHSGESVHPDVARSPAWWSRGRRYLAVTPYPGGDSSKENPSLFVGAGTSTWELPPGAPNPVQYPTSGYLSDPDVLFNPDANELWMYYRGVTNKNVVYLIRSADAVTWTPPLVVADAPNHALVSPSVVRLAPSRWLMWSVNAGPVGCTATSTRVELRESTNGVEWGAPRTVDMPAPPSGLAPWHLEVQWIPSRKEYWAVFNGKDGRSCGTTALYLATSVDGVTWQTRPRPLLVAGETPELQHIVYRSTFEYDDANGEITFWYSGAKVGTPTVWRTIAQRLSTAQVLARTGASSGDLRALAIPEGVDLRDPP